MKQGNPGRSNQKIQNRNTFKLSGVRLDSRMVKNQDRSGKALSQAIKDQLTIGVQTSIKFVSYFTKVLV